MWCSPWVNTRTDVVSLKLETRSTRGRTLKNSATEFKKKTKSLSDKFNKISKTTFNPQTLKKNAVNVLGFCVFPYTHVGAELFSPQTLKKQRKV